MMNRILCLIVCATITNMVWAQDLHVASGGSFFISPASFTYVTNDINVDGDLIVTSDTSTQKSGSLIVKGTATGDITYERNIQDANWHLVSAPVTTQAIGAFATNLSNAVKTQVDLYAIGKYNNANLKDARWEHYTALTAGGLNFASGKGYSTSRAAAGNFTFKGGMATDDVTVTIPENDITPFVPSVSAITGSHVWSVVGNPYPSFLPANTPAGASNVLLNNIASLDLYKHYINVWDGSAYVPINHSSPAYYIAPGQAFMVDAIGNSQSFVFSEATQVPQSEATAVFYRGTTTPEIIVHLSNGTETKKTTLRYFNTSTTGLDVGYDAGTFDTSFPFAIDTHLVSDSPGMDFTIQCLPDTNFEASIVPLSIKAAANETITFRTEVAGLPDGLEVYLEDKEARTITNISTGNHQVTLGEKLDGIGRFYLHNSVNGVLSTEDLLASTLNIYKTSNSNLRITGLQEGPATVKMYSVLGKEVTSSSFQMKTVNDIAIPNHLAKGIYIVQLITNEAKQSRKIIIE